MFSTENTREVTDKASIKNSVLLPAMDMAITLEGQCVDGNNSLTIDYNLIPRKRCPIRQDYFAADEKPLDDILNRNDKYYDLLSANLKLFNYTNFNQNKMRLDIQYAFFRNTLTCLMNNYDGIKNQFFNNSTSNTTANQQELMKIQLTNVLQVFVNLDVYFTFQQIIQIIILALNCFVVFMNLVFIFIRFTNLCCSCLGSGINVAYVIETYLSFTTDLIIAVLGGCSYFILSQFSDFLSNLFSTLCLDNYVQYQLGTYGDAIDNTGDENLQIFILMIIKVAILMFSCNVFCCTKGCKEIECKAIEYVIRENINEGESPEEEQSLKLANVEMVNVSRNAK